MRIHRPSSHPRRRSRARRDRIIPAALLVLLVALLASGYALGGRQAMRRLFPGLYPETGDNATRAVPAAGDHLPQLSLRIGGADYRTMEVQRQEALAAGYLDRDEADWVQAQIQLQDEVVSVLVQLKEGWTGDPRGQKWPLEVEVQADPRSGAQTPILGMRSFSLQSPARRGYLNEWLYVEDLRRAGVLAPRYQYVRLSVNGADWGVYALQEGASQEWLEAQGRQRGVILHLDQGALWRQWAAPAQEGDADLASLLPVAVHDPARIEGDPTLRAQRDAALELLRAFQSRQLSPSQVFDVDQVGRCLARAHLWGARDGVEWCSEWYYYDPLTARLEPIAIDPYSNLPPGVLQAGPAQYDDLAVMAAYVAEAMQVTQPAYLAELRSAYGEAFEANYVALAGEFASLDMEAPWTRLPGRQELLLRSLDPARSPNAAQIVHAYRLGGILEDATSVEVCTLSSYPVRLHAVRVGESELEVQPGWIVPSGGADPGSDLIHPEALPAVVLRPVQGDVPRYLSLRIPLAALDAQPAALQIVASVVGVDQAVAVDVRDQEPALSLAPPAQPSPGEALARHAFLRRADRPGFLALRPGTWEVEGDLVLPAGYGLLATEPVTLRFDRGAVLYASGPLLLDGPKEDAIRLLPRHAGWGGLIVHRAEAGEGSVLHNVQVRGANGAQRDGWETTAGLSFYGGEVTLSHCHVSDVTARDAVQVVRADLSVVGARFERLGGSALSGWFVRGDVRHSTFGEVGGDGIRLIGSRVDVQDVTLSRIRGAAISASEGSEVTIDGLYATDVFLAVVSKDRSSVNAQNVRIARAWAAGFAAFHEVIPSAGAQIDARGVAFEDDSPAALVQEGSSATIDGETMIAGELDLDALRHRQRTLAAMQSLDYRFGDAIRLVGYEIATPAPAPGESLVFTLYWTAMAGLERDYTVFVHVLAGEGQVAVGWDNMPAQNAFPTTRWRVGRLVEDTHVVPLPPDLPAGAYAVSAGLYYLPTGERLPLYDAQGGEVLEQRVRLEPLVRVGNAQ